MEDNLNILKVEYLSNHLFLNLSLDDQTISPANEDEGEKVEYLSNLLLDLPQILNSSLGDQTI
jgi:hypothetical protein